MTIFEKSDVDLVLHDAKIVDENLNVLFPSFFEEIVKKDYLTMR